MPGIDKECEGPGATHFGACACRERRFAKMEIQLEHAKTALKFYADLQTRLGFFVAAREFGEEKAILMDATPAKKTLERML